MTTMTIQAVVAAAQQLSPTEQFELIQVLTRRLQQRFLGSGSSSRSPQSISFPEYIRRTPPVTSIAELAADFWPEDESADDINDYITQQRKSDRDQDLPNP